VAKNYEERKQQVANILREQSKEGRDIGPLPAVVDPARRDRCRLDFRDFCETYFPAVFNLVWSVDHLAVIQTIQQAITGGGLFAVAMPRGSGKTSLTLAAAIWALLYGHRRFVVLIGASEDAAVDLLDHLRSSLESNDLLNEDFPEVCFPIRKLEGIVSRQAGQLLDGERTQIHITQKELILPTVTGSASSGACVKVAGITGRVRGMMIQRPSDGATVRPDFVMIDDPQTDESAASPMQVQRRLNTVNGAILGLSGPGQKIAGVMPVTVIARGDLADVVLDRKRCPDWQGLKFGLMKSMPTNVKLWEQYSEIRAQGLRTGEGLTPATAFYLEHQQELDEGAEASWPARFNSDEASAIQHAMNLKFRDEATFAAEYQNQPLSLDAGSVLAITPDQVIGKTVATKRLIVPSYATKLTAMIDVQGSVLFYSVGAFGPDFTSHVVDYGCYPEQARNYFFLREVKPTLADLKPGAAFEGQLYDGLDKLTKKLIGTNYQIDGGDSLRISRVMIDAGYRDDVVKQFIRESPNRSILLASKGYGFQADRKPLDEWMLKAGGRRGWSWLFNRDEGHVLFDANAWKTLIAQRLMMSAGEQGNLSLFEADPNEAANRARHKMFSEHLTSESATPVEANGRTVNVWRVKPNRENHWLDCVIGCYVAASEQGIAAVGHPTADQPKRRRPKLKLSF
jgi:hypothetical protein